VQCHRNPSAATTGQFDWAGSGASTVNKTFDGLNRDATITALTGGYDTNENLTYDGARTFVYDGDNRLVSESATGTSTTLAYDPTGRLQTQSTTTGGTTTGTTYLYDGAALIAEYITSSGTVLRRYVHGPGTDNPLVWYEGATMPTASVRYLVTDRQGTVIGYSDSTGTVSSPGAIYAYDAYGAPVSWGGSRFRYTGQIELPELALYHYKARVYDPVMGHFLQNDPIGYKDNLDLYAYVGNDPLDRTDPSGNDAVWVNNADGSKTLIIPVQFSGSGATPANVAAIVARDNSLSISDPNLHVQVVSTNTPINGVLNKMDFSPGYNNSMCGAAGECVNKLGGNTAHINSANPQSTDAAAHDDLHFAGIKDQYVEGPRDAQGNRTSSPSPGYTNSNIMTSRSGTELKPQQFNEAKTNQTTKQCSVDASGKTTCH
jgi:RHS repeat-associated protein